MSLTPSQQYALDQVMSGKNVFVSGGGGVGKSYLANRIIADLESRGKKSWSPHPPEKPRS